jgi:hypothetical protein
VDDVAELEAELVCLRDDLGCTAEIAEPAESVLGCAARDEVWAGALRAEMIDQSLEASLVSDPPLRRIVVEGRAEQVTQKDVADPAVVRAWRPYPVVVQEHTLEPDTSRSGGRLAGVVRLQGADGDQRVRACLQRLADEELELAGLVAAAGKTGQVVALDPDLRAAEGVRQAAKRMDRRRQTGKPGARPAVEYVEDRSYTRRRPTQLDDHLVSARRRAVA